jgi:hypothetical protein
MPAENPANGDPHLTVIGCCMLAPVDDRVFEGEGAYHGPRKPRRLGFFAGGGEEFLLDPLKEGCLAQRLCSLRRDTWCEAVYFPPASCEGVEVFCCPVLMDGECQEVAWPGHRDEGDLCGLLQRL